MSRQPSTQIVDIGSPIAAIENYYFLGVSGTVTISGFLVDVTTNARARNASGLAPAFTATIPAANAGVTDGVALTTLMGLTGTLTANYPNAAGMIINLAGNVYVDIQDSGSAHPDFKTNPTRYPVFNSGNGVPLGRVAN